MRIIISPAKKMRVDTDSLPWHDLPVFLPKTRVLYERLRAMTPEELKALWNCSDKLTAQNVERLQNMSLSEGLTPAILAYEGIQYQHMAPGVFSDEEFAYIQEHLRILSGFYGVLRPFDGVTPYRLEMQAKLETNLGKDLYAFWGDSIARALLSETECILNLASKEYSLCVSNHLPQDFRWITCVFGVEKQGKVIEKGTLCKMARGEMVRYLAENHIQEPEQVKAFQGLNFCYSPTHSDANNYVFIENK